MYYMVIQDGSIIDVLSTLSYVRTQVVHNRLMMCSQELAEGILSSDTSTIYYVKELIEENIKGYPEVTLTEIDEERYNILLETLELNETIDASEYVDDTDSSNIDSEDVSEEEQITIEFMRESKINEMSNACEAVITSGFDIVLADGESHHFDFTLEEQANFMFFKSAIDAGSTSIPYHAKDEACRYFTAEEILSIIDMGISLKTYHTTYFNSLKQYIKSLETVDEIYAIYYGISIPEEYCSEVLISLMTTV